MTQDAWSTAAVHWSPMSYGLILCPDAETQINLRQGTTSGPLSRMTGISVWQRLSGPVIL